MSERGAAVAGRAAAPWGWVGGVMAPLFGAKSAGALFAARDPAPVAW